MFHFTSPLKLFEYIASGKPFVSTLGGATDEILATLNVYGVYDDMTDFLNLVSSGRKDGPFSAQASRIAYENSWEARAEFTIRSYVGRCV